MIVYTEKLENAIIIAAAHQPLRYHGSVVKFSDLTPEILAGLSAEFTQFGFIRSQIGNEEALLTWGEGLLRMRGLRDLKPEDIPEKNRLLFVACTRAKEELYISGVTIAVSTAAEDVENLFLNECLQVAGEMYGDEKEEFAS